MVAWGVVMTLMGIVQNYRGLLVARLFLGVAEAGLYPGVACESERRASQHNARPSDEVAFLATLGLPSVVL